MDLDKLKQKVTELYDYLAVSALLPIFAVNSESPKDVGWVYTLSVNFLARLKATIRIRTRKKRSPNGDKLLYKSHQIEPLQLAYL